MFAPRTTGRKLARPGAPPPASRQADPRVRHALQQQTVHERVGAQRVRPFGHELHAVENKAGGEDEFPEKHERAGLFKQGHRKAERDQQGSDEVKLEREELHCDGRAEVRAQNDAERLPQGHELGAGEPH
jgi:hypothetical protein